MRHRLIPLRWILFGLALGLLLPAVGFAGLLVLRIGAQDRLVAEDRLLHRARTLADAIDAEMNASVRALEALATSSDLDVGGDLARFHGEARRVQLTQPLWVSVVLFAADGRPLEDTSQAEGLPTEGPLDAASLRRSVDTRAPVIGPLARRPNGEPAFAIHVPVMRDDRVRFILSATVRPAIVARVLASGGAAKEDFTRTVTDTEDRVVARTRDPDAHLGEPATPIFRRSTAGRLQGVFPSTSLDGHDSYVAFRRTALAQWVTTVVVLRDEIDGPLRRSIALVATSGICLLVLGAGGAFLLGRRLSREIAAARDAARDLAHGREPSAVTSGIEEIVQLGSALTRSSELIHQHERERAGHLHEAEVARAFAEEASRTKDEFLAMLGHELRNPLAPIVSAIELEKLRGGRLGRELSIVDRQVRHLVRLVEDLVDISRITRGKITLRRSPVEVSRVVDRALEMTGPLFAERRQQVEVDVAPRGLVVDGDPDRLTQVFGNLLSNAAKYTPVRGRISVRAERVSGDDAGERVVVRVKDDGNGIDADLLPRIFDPFVQGRRSAARQEGGLGIGLTLVRRLVGAHGGVARARSDGPGRGATFDVELPLLADERDAAERTSATMACRVTEQAVSVLVVDDNEDAADLLAELLARAGHDVRCAHDAQGALDLLEEQPPDVAILDIGLPGMDGYALAMRIREDLAEQAPALVALTGYGQPTDRARSLEVGFDVHLVKPPDHRALLGLVQRLADERRRPKGPPPPSEPLRRGGEARDDA